MCLTDCGAFACLWLGWLGRMIPRRPHPAPTYIRMHQPAGALMSTTDLFPRRSDVPGLAARRIASLVAGGDDRAWTDHAFCKITLSRISRGTSPARLQSVVYLDLGARFFFFYFPQRKRLGPTLNQDGQIRCYHTPYDGGCITDSQHSKWLDEPQAGIRRMMVQCYLC